MRLNPYTVQTRRRRRTQPRARSLRTTLAAATTVLLGTTVIALTAGSAQAVTLDVDGHLRTVTTTADTVSGALAAAHIPVTADTTTAPTLDAPLISGTTVQVRHAHPVTFVLDGYTVTRNLTAATVAELTAALTGPGGAPHVDAPADTVLADAQVPVHVTAVKTFTLQDGDAPARTVRTYATTPAEALTQAGITLGAFDAVDAPLGAPLADGALVRVSRASVVDQVERVPLPAPSTTVDDPTLPVGASQVRSSGSDGVVTRTWRVVSRSGVQLDRTVKGEQRTDPVAQVVAVGTKVAAPGDARGIGQQLAAGRGWTGAQWTCLDQLFTAESSWRFDAANPSGAYGIPQALPGSKMASAGSDWATNPATQITWGMGYVAGRYGTPCAAWSFHVANGWY